MTDSKKAGIYARYWAAYGGWSALLRSGYLWGALALLPITFKLWLEPSCTANGCSAWWDLSLGVLPNLLGFTLGGFAVFLGFGDSRFVGVISTPSNPKNPFSLYVMVCSNFVHFILVQMMALLAAVIAKSLWFEAEWMQSLESLLPYGNAFFGFIGFGLFLYALMLLAATTMQLFMLASMHERVLRFLDSKPEQ